ncbi:Multidrug and toxin extrusion (MATE) family efflux pump YdhE/NorM, homolog, partial [hydrothermal vent metagenome]
MQTQNPPINGWMAELRATFFLAWPLVVAQLAGVALTATDVVMMGWLGPEQLAAGSLATSVFFPLFIGGVGVVSATAPLIAQAIGAKKGRSVRRTVRQGFWLAFIATIIITPLVLQTGDFFLVIGQNPAIAALAQSYLSTAVFMVFP